MSARRGEADRYYADLQKDMVSQDERVVQRQAFAGLIWSKQFYYFDVPRWLKGDPGQPPPPQSRCTAATSSGAISTTRTSYRCRTNGNTPGMPPGICVSLHSVRLIDAQFAKHQLCC